MGTFQELTNFQNLYNSYKKSLKGKRKKAGAIKFRATALENLCIIKRQLVQHTYKLSPYSEFVVREPKKRIIKAGSFRDKVVQHCLCDYVLLPVLKNVFIQDNCAGQIGKGTLFGLNRLSEHMKAFYFQHGLDGYILKCDISKFFYSINHDIMKKIIQQHFSDPDIQWVCNLLIDSTDGDGLALGNQTSQVFALMYLNGLDHYITEDLGCHLYGRYMDDFYLISHSKEYLKDCLKKIRYFLSQLCLTLNSKTEIVHLTKGLRYLGFHSYLTKNGDVIRVLSGENKRKAKKKIRRSAKLVIEGKMSQSKFDERQKAWRNHASKGNCYNLLKSIDQFTEQVFADLKARRNA